LTGVDLPSSPAAWEQWWKANQPPRLIQRLAEAQKEAVRAAEGLARWAGSELGTDPEPWRDWWKTYEPTFTKEHQEPFEAALARLQEAVDRHQELAVRRLRKQQQPGQELTPEPEPAAAVPSEADVERAAAQVAAAAGALEAVTGTDLDTTPEGWQLWWDANEYRLRDSFVDAGERVASVFIGYGRWVWHMAHGDFGESMMKRTTEGSKDPAALYLERAHVTVSLNVVAEIFIFFIAIPVGLASARYRGRLFDRASTIVLLGFWSVPQVLAGTLLLGYLAKGGEGLQWFDYAGLYGEGWDAMPLGRKIADLLLHVTLPIACLVYAGLAYLAKLGRASLLESIRTDYVRTARAKGLPERRVVYHHALRNSLLPMITTMVMMLPALLGGSVVVERIFSIPGMGQLLVDAATQQDLAVIMFGTLVFGVLTLVSLLVGDVLYAWADPRIRYD
jgi:peptide/nickel transport system permease protein